MTTSTAPAGGAAATLLPLDPNLPRDQLLQNLRMNALLSHQVSMGRGDELVQLLKRTIAQMETTHTRVQNMSTILFVAGLVLLGVGVIQIAFGGGGQEVWGALLGATGGVASLAATFWTAPLEKMSDSISDLVKLEAAFLGYIRVIGEIDSAFQMQYLDILAGSATLSLDQVMNDTTTQMKQMMEKTLELIDRYVVGPGHSLTEVQKQVAALDKELRAAGVLKATA